LKIDNEFTVGVPIDRAWAVLTDLEGIAPCMPGAVLTGVEGDVYSGKVKVKVGPITSEYTGTAQFVLKDETSHRAVIDAKGRDVRGAGNAAAAITAQLRAEGSSTVVSVDTDLKISGKVAQFGSGMIKEVSAKLLGQFVDCLEGKLAVETPEPAVPVAAEPSAAAPAAGQPATSAPAAQPSTSAPAAQPSAAAPAAQPSTAAEGSAAPATAGDAPVSRTVSPSAEPEALDLMSVAGRSVLKRLLPLVAVLVVVVAVIVYFAVR
jgi:carbon monoxide dehydrogenase subunit G